jgi:hypothetical protein
MQRPIGSAICISAKSQASITGEHDRQPMKMTSLQVAAKIRSCLNIQLFYSSAVQK